MIDRFRSGSHSDLIYFAEVARVGNISRSAERLGIAQPSLSAAIVRLEQRLDTALLIRSKSGVELTRDGKLLATRIRGFLLEWDSIEVAIKHEREEPAGRFTLGCHVSIALNWLPAHLPGLLKRWPRLELEISHDLSRRITEQVVSHRLDFGLVINPVRHPDLVLIDLGKDVFTFWGRDESLSDTVLYDPDLLQSQTLLRKLEKHGHRFTHRFTSSSLDLLGRMSANGAGTAILPSHLALQMRPSLRKPRGDLPALPDTLCLAYRADAQRSPGARALMSALKAIG